VTSGKKPPADPAPVLPPGLDVLWGKRDKSQRGPKPALTVEAIVEAAIALADTKGLEAVSMANVAKELGFTTMSLYRHVASKEELLQLMWNGSAQGAESLVLTGKGWRERLKEWAIIQRQMIDRHPWITQMPMAAPPLAPNSLAFVECGMASMDGTPLPDGAKMRFIGLISSYTLSEARMAYDERRAAEAGAREGGAVTSYETLLRIVVEPDRFPRLHRLAWAAEPGQGPSEWDMFVAGLETILDGIQALMDRMG
jgi:AcrR family transcriptional regulator